VTEGLKSVSADTQDSVNDQPLKEALMILGIDRGVPAHVTAALAQEQGILSACAVTL
jgi:D-3-phosphoglycerate dehydrogenase